MLSSFALVLRHCRRRSPNPWPRVARLGRLGLHARDFDSDSRMIGYGRCCARVFMRRRRHLCPPHVVLGARASLRMQVFVMRRVVLPMINICTRAQSCGRRHHAVCIRTRSCACSWLCHNSYYPCLYFRVVCAAQPRTCARITTRMPTSNLVSREHP